jgi:predicted Rossmann fold flavoprotein
MRTADVIIAGGGASGMFAAAVCAESKPALDILILEKGPGVLAKVRISGGGRCNLTHECSDIREFIRNYPRGGKELTGPLHHFGPADTMKWFDAHGVPLVTLNDGCVFPRSDSSETVIQALLGTVRRGRVEIRTATGVSQVIALPDGDAHRFELVLSDRSLVRCRRLLVATGGGAVIEGLGHPVVPCVPSLFAFKTPDRELAALAGIVVDEVVVSAAGWSGEGALLITHGGVSGPAVLRLSSVAARRLADCGYRFEAKINWCPSLREEGILEALEAYRDRSPRRQTGTWSPVGLPLRLWLLLLGRAGVESGREWGACPLKSLRQLAGMIHAFPLPIAGRDPHREEFVTAGGIGLKTVDFRTMESRLHPCLYFAGEVLDIDGMTGGYNLQAAWTTGCIAARHWISGN